ncbi:MAG: protein kinase [Deltaproteobacteria bacterium]
MEVGTLIDGRFEIQARAGRGGMGAVYRAHDRATGAPVALKLIDTVAPALLARFARESRVLGELKHPGIVRYVAHGDAPLGGRFLAMEWLEGRDLAARLADGPLSVADALAVVRAVADAVGSAHAAGVVHRDLKPSNIFLVGDDVERAKVLDFGVAAARDATIALTQTGVAIGTPGYMPPEQARAGGEVDARADVYALGCVVFELIAGRGPFASEHFVAALVKSVLDRTPRLAERVPNVPENVDALVHRMMAKGPADRPADGRAVAAEIDELGDFASAPTATPTLTSAEQRSMSVVLVTDLVPPHRAGMAGPDDETRESRPVTTPGRYVANGADDARVAVESLGGRFEVLFGGALLATFEVGAAATDQVHRGARCALELRRQFPAAAIVLATGRGATSDGVSSGEVVDRAVRLLEVVQAHADLGPAIMLDPSSFGLLEGRFEIFCTLAGHVLIGERDALHAERKILGRQTPCVGRASEVGSLVATFDACVEEPVARAVVLTGPPGVGKSRVRQEMIRRLRERGERVEVWFARGDAVRAGSPFAMASDLVRDAAGLRGGEDLQTCHRRLEQRVARHVNKSEVTRVTQLLAEMIGAPFSDGVLEAVQAARGDPLSMGDQMKKAFEDLVAAECAVHPLLVVLEDLQWGDGATVQFVDAALRYLPDVPLMVLATARPEVEQTFGRPWAERGAQHVRIGPLTPRASKKLVRAVLDDLDEGRVDALVERAGGHPLLIEEMMRAAHDGRDEGLPDTALALVQARVLALDGQARRLLRAASVFGRSFFASGVTALLVGDRVDPVLEEWLSLLAEQEWIVKRASSRFTGEAEYGFAQDVVREALYAMLTDEDRRLAHRLAGDWLARAGERDDVVLARHFELGEEPARAVDHYTRAAEQALDGNDFAATVEYGERAEALASQAHPLGVVRALQAQAHFHLGAYERAFELAERAADLLPAGSVMWCRAVGVLSQSASKMSKLELVQKLATQLLGLEPESSVAYAAATAITAVQLLILGDRTLAIELCDRLDRFEGGPPLLRGYVAHAQSARWAFSQDPGRAVIELRVACDAFESAGDIRTLCALRKTLGWYAGECGALEEGERALAESIALAERLGLANLVAHAKYDAASPLIRLGRLDEARGHLVAALEVFEAQRDARLTSGALASLSWVERLAGNIAAAIETARRAVDAAPSPPARIVALAFLAEAELAANRATNAWRVAEEGLALLGDVGVTEEGSVSLRLVRAEALSQMGEPQRARTAIAEAEQTVHERAARIGDAALRLSFTTRIEENRRTLELAQAWR